MRPLAALSIFLMAACGASSCPSPSAPPPSSLRDPNSAPDSIHLAIGGIDGDGRFPMAQVFSGFGCTGENKSPALSWTDAPESTQSFALIMHDPDAPTGVGFFHWIVVNIPRGTTSLPEGGPLPEGAHELHTDFGNTGYGGPCPPPGAPHRYEITLYALSTPSLDLPDGATGALARFMVGQSTLALGRATATYGRAEFSGGAVASPSPPTE
jgi:Raf kinase inhibitor-like YbhB/YbcL family protein